MTYRLQNLMLAMLLALTTLFAGLGTLSQNPASGGYQLFERAASGLSADIQLGSLENFAPPPETTSEYANAPNSVPSRPLTAGDLGINGQLDELTGTFSVQNGVANVRIDMIEGTISNPLSVVDNIIDTARANGATSLRLEGTLANDRLLAIMQRRYGATTSGANDVIDIQF